MLEKAQKTLKTFSGKVYYPINYEREFIKQDNKTKVCYIKTKEGNFYDIEKNPKEKLTPQGSGYFVEQEDNRVPCSYDFVKSSEINFIETGKTLHLLVGYF
jgi:hypothetical protein